MPETFSGEERAEALLRTNTARRAGRRYVGEWAKTVLIAITLFFILRAFLIEAFKIPSGSMERTLLVGDFLLVDKLIYGAEVPFTNLHLPAVRGPKRGEVVVFEYPVNPTQNFVKRLVGLPGDTLAMEDGVLLLNGMPLDEPYVTHSAPDLDPVDQEFGWQQRYIVHAAEPHGGYHPSRNNWGPLIVPPQNYFVLGDNRDNSLDSRYWGFVPDSLLKGRPLVVYFSFAPDTTERFSWLTRIRWHRLGERIR